MRRKIRDSETHIALNNMSSNNDGKLPVSLLT